MKRVTPVLLCFILILAGCQPAEEPNTEALVQTALAETAVMKTLIAEGAASTFAAIPTITLTPTPTLTPTLTPYPPVTALVILNAYCRPGPDAIYGQGMLLERGENVMVVGRLDDAADWLLVQPPDGVDTCWVTKEALSITGETAWVEIVLAPPTPTPVPNWNGNWTTWFAWGASVDEFKGITTITQTGNQVSGTFTGYNANNYKHTFTFQGVSSSDGYTIDAMVTSMYLNTTTIHLERDPNNPHVFRGELLSGAVISPFCGTKLSGGAKPNPCLP